MTREPDRPLKILHVMRAPVGGLFRHVVDLARGQAARGHRVGIVADSTTGGAAAEAKLAELRPYLALGLSRVPMSRHIARSDLDAVADVAQHARDNAVDVVHGHGAKGGAYARLARAGTAIRVYTPHGGSLHYSWASPVGLFYLAAERLLMRRTDLILFESAYGRDTFRAKIGPPTALTEVVHNGVTPAEFMAVEPEAGASDLVFVGELRVLKGVDVLIDAIALLTREGRAVTATIVGEGPDRAAFEARVAARQLGDAVRFVGAMPARAAFARGQLLVVPSRAESLPYIVLEAAAATVPMIASNVGGIPEIFGPDAGGLVPPGDAAALAAAIGTALAEPAVTRAAAWRLRMRIGQSFSADAMTDAVLAAYRTAMAGSARKAGPEPRHG
jgi:glycosyltransferase involved in cell wall biosynthesis